MDKTSISPKRVLVFGATGTAGSAAVRDLRDAGHHVTCFLRSDSPARSALPSDVEMRFGNVTDPKALRDVAFAGAPFDAVVSCLASRSGLPADAWAIDCEAHRSILRAAQAAHVGHMVQLSAICVQKPKLAFQQAKLAFEKDLVASGLTYSIVRPTAFFKSLSGQFDRVQNGKPFLVFGDGRLTACKPISDRDLGRYMTRCLSDPDLQNKILPIGGPSPALTPLDQAELLFQATGQTPRIRHVPLAMMRAIAGALTGLGYVDQGAAQKAELAKIGLYYGSESMLVWDADRHRYDADATPEFGSDRLEEHYRAMAEGRVHIDLGVHAVF